MFEVVRFNFQLNFRVYLWIFSAFLAIYAERLAYARRSTANQGYLSQALTPDFYLKIDQKNYE